MSNEHPERAKKIFTSTRAVFFAAWVCLPAWIFDPRELPPIVSVPWLGFVLLILVEAFVLWRREVRVKRAANKGPHK